MKNNFKKFLIFSLLFVFSFSIYSQTSLSEPQNPVKITYNGGGNYTLVERTDLRRYDNGKYVGLVTREVRSFINRTSAPKGFNSEATFYEGSFYVQEDTRRALQNVKNGIHESIPSSFRITSDGELIMIEDHGFPSFRSFPSFSASNVKIGDRWQAKAERAVDPLNKGIVTKIPMYVEYTFLGETVSRGEEVYVLKAQWATRYGISYFDFGGDRDLKSATGKHVATMHISKYSGYAIVVRDSVDETFIYSDGNQVSFKGTISLFTEYPPAVDRDKLIPALQRVASLSDEEAEKLKEPLIPHPELLAKSDDKSSSDVDKNKNPLGYENQPSKEPQKSHEKDNASTSKESSSKKSDDFPNPFRDSSKNKNEKTSENKNDIKIENTEAGIRLTIQNLHFVADSSSLLPGEESRLDSIADLLKQVPSSQFLVEGHTAKTGNDRGEQRLSEERAAEIAKELSKRGIQEGRFIVKGSGSRKPIADNSTSEGKARNRRVEITILE